MARPEPQDAEEFFSYLLNGLASVLPTQRRGEQSNLVQDLFQIRFRCT